MTYDPAKPRYSLPFNGKDYELEGSFALIEAVEYALKDNIVRIIVRTAAMPTSDMARLLAAILSHHGEKFTPKDIGEILWGLGLASDAYAMLCLHVHAFLSIVVAKPEEREKATKDMGELLGGLKNQATGQPTNASA